MSTERRSTIGRASTGEETAENGEAKRLRALEEESGS